MSKSDLVDITMKKLAETGKAILVSDTDHGEGVWLPLSQCEVSKVKGKSQYVVITMPEWLALKNGLI
jgi:hypothetical protein